MSFPTIDGYVVTEKLGSGSYSTVYKAYAKVGARSIVAVKCVEKSRIKDSGTAVDNIITEIRLLKTLTHPHIVHMKHFTWDDKNIYIIMEYCCGGDLSKYIQRYGRVPEKQVLFFLQQLASALKFLREKGVVHMDLKPQNLLLHKGASRKYTLKVADFGFAAYLSGSLPRSVRGSPLYMAPEVLRGDYDERVDLWSVGVIMYECLFGKAPYSSNTFKELISKIRNQTPIQIPPNSSIAPGGRALLQGLLQHDPSRRISYESFFANEYLDLVHMPSKENYEKAVSLIKQAVSLDARGHTSPAFVSYRDALRYLVPAAAVETDAARRGALTDKLTRYMERAEEIKQIIECEQANASTNVPTNVPTNLPTNVPTNVPTNLPTNVTTPTAPTAGCCGRAANAGSYEYGELQTPPLGVACARADAQPTVAYERVESSDANARPGLGLRRLFGRQSSVPYLNRNDSSVVHEMMPSAKERMKKYREGLKNDQGKRAEHLQKEKERDRKRQEAMKKNDKN